jgi:catecholate siderophore receptor
LKEAGWSTVRQATLQTGSYLDRRVAVDVGEGINQNVAVRFNAFYEQSDTFRDFGHLERYRINPTISLRPTDDTKLKLSYEFFHDERLADRGNPSQGLGPAATRFNPTTPFVSSVSSFFVSPLYNGTYANVHTVMGPGQSGRCA